MSDNPVVIAGFGVRLPGGVSTVAQAYDAFCTGASRLSPLANQPMRLWSRSAEGLPLAAGLVDGPDLFDPAFFGISPRVAQEMDPQQRWALMCATEAIRESGIPLKVRATSSFRLSVRAQSMHVFHSLCRDCLVSRRCKRAAPASSLVRAVTTRW